MRLPSCFLFLMLMVPSVHAASLYKCAGPQKNAVSIQSAPCPAGTQQIWKRDGTPDPPPTEQQIAASHAKRRQDAADATSLSRMAGSERSRTVTVYRNSTQADDQKQRCDSAKRQALRIRERDWKSLTIEALRKLDDWVESECKKA